MSVRGVLTWALAVAGVLGVAARPMTARVIQPAYAADEKGTQASFDWMLAELDRCTEQCDLIVLPEFSDVPGRIPYGARFYDFATNANPRLLAKCAATAARCRAIVFVNCLDLACVQPRNTTWAFDRTGTCVGRYYKRHVTAGERDQCGFDVSYTRTWSEPDMLEIDGIRFAFLTCYDFYFYEAFSNLARYRPDIVIGCSLQRSDPQRVLRFINPFCAYNTGAYLIRASVSMGRDAAVGGSSMVVAPSGEILRDFGSGVGAFDVRFDPAQKYLKPAGFGNPPATHPSYVEIGRRPWQYRPAGSAIVPPFAEAPAKRLCAHRGLPACLPENSLIGFAAAVGLGASEIEMDLWWTADGEIVSVHDATLDRVSDGHGRVTDKTYAELKTLDFGVKRGKAFAGLRIMRFADVLARLSCHVLMNVHIKGVPPEPRTDAALRDMLALVDAYDARRHLYFMTANGAIHDRLARLAPDIPRCMGHDARDPNRIVERAIAHKCQMVQLFKPHFDADTVRRAHAAGLRCNVFFANDPDEARRYLDMGVDTILTDAYQTLSNATGLK